MGGCVTRQTSQPGDNGHCSPCKQDKDLNRDLLETGDESPLNSSRKQCHQTPKPCRPLPGVGSRNATPTRFSEHLLNKVSVSNGNSRTNSPHHVIHSPEPRRTSLPPRTPNAPCYLDEVILQDSPCRRIGNGTPTLTSGSRSSSLKRYQNNNHIMQPVSNQSLLVALFNYRARTKEELTFQSGDRLLLLDQIYPEWWYVEHTATSRRGYIPVPLIALENTLESKSWYLGHLPRKEAERQLLMPTNPRGTYLVRESESHKTSYSLSVLDYDSGKGRDTVKHYRIRMLDGAAGFYITSKEKFPSMQSLIDHYSAGANGLCCQLSQPCGKPLPTIGDLSFQTRDQWEIPREQLVVVEPLGSGQFGEVWRGVFNGTLEVAIKMLKTGSMSRSDFLKEAKIMKRLNHPKLVKLFAVCTEEDPVYIVTELMANGSLLTYIRGVRLELALLVDIMGQIASGMAYLEEEKFIHRDLAARNILVGANNVVKVADFGLSRAITETDGGEYTAKQGAKFPIKWTSPEAALLGRFSVKSDVWSYGVVLYEIITHGQIPYPGMNNNETLNAVESGYRMPRPGECPKALYDIMLECWHEQADLRPTFIFLRDFFDDFFPASEPNYRSTNPVESYKQSPTHQVQLV